MGLFSSLFGGKSKDQTSTTTTSTPLSPYASAYAKRLEDLSKTPYQAYTGDRVADLTSNQLQGIGQASATAYDPYLAAIGSTRRISSAELDEYMNPYLENVGMATERQMARRIEQQRQADEFAAERAGAFGGSRHGVMGAERERNYNTALDEMWNKTYAGGYESAMDKFNKQREAEARGALGAAQATTSGIANLMNTGGVEYGVDQAALNAAYQQFVEGRDWEWNRAKEAAGATNAMQGIAGSTSSTTKPGAPSQGLLAPILGAGMQAAAMWGTGGLSALASPMFSSISSGIGSLFGPSQGMVSPSGMDVASNYQGGAEWGGMGGRPY